LSRRQGFEHRFLEGRWRAENRRSRCGAALAFGRLRDAVDISADLDVDRRAAVAACSSGPAVEEREALRSPPRSSHSALAPPPPARSRPSPPSSPRRHIFRVAAGHRAARAAQ
jgi:hypothetical protein